MPSAVGRCLLAAAVLLAAAGALADVALPEPACGFQTELTAYFINEPVTEPLCGCGGRHPPALPADSTD